MEYIREYKLDGVTLKVPLIYDEKSDKYIEDYREWIEKKVYTPSGYPIIFAGEDACKFAREATPGGCPDCGSCMHYVRANEHTWIGICKNTSQKQTPPNAED